MPYVNKVILVGELSADAEGRSRPNSTDVIANLRVETRQRFPDRATGQMREVSDFHRVVVFGRLPNRRELSRYVGERRRPQPYAQVSGERRHRPLHHRGER
jgi:single-strand DNA-binding protein